MVALKRSLTDYRMHISTHSQSSVRRDGTVIPLIVETLVVLRSLAEYTDVINTLPRSVLIDEKEEVRGNGSHTCDWILLRAFSDVWYAVRCCTTIVHE